MHAILFYSSPKLQPDDLFSQSTYDSVLPHPHLAHTKQHHLHFIYITNDCIPAPTK